MIYLYWFLMLLLSSIISIICYFTNWIIVLFCDKDGELPYPLSLWQTWDASVYSDYVVHDKLLPEIFLYNYDKHYIVFNSNSPEFEKYATPIMKEKDKELKEVNRDRWYSYCYNNNFTIKEKIQRYICAVYWLTRNCSYGFGFWLFGVSNRYEDLNIIIETNNIKFVKSKANMSWSYANFNKIFSIFKYNINWNIYIGWKIPTDINDNKLVKSMIANRFLSFKIRNIED